MLWFVTDSERPAAATAAIVAAIADLDGVVILLRDKRSAWDRRLLAEVARCAPRFVVHVGAESAAMAESFGALGWHAPEAIWRRLEHAPAGLISVADHDGDGVAFAARCGIAAALVSPIWIDKGRPARGTAAFAESSGQAASRAVLQIALGGVVSAHEAELAHAAGADGVAVQRALYAAADPAELAGALGAPFAARRARAASLLSR